MMPVAVYGLKVPTGEIMVPAAIDFPATIRITMAAIDPTQAPEADGEGNVPNVPKSTLKIRKVMEDDDDDNVASLLADSSDDDEDAEEEEANGGPSDPSKSKKARMAAIKKLLIEAEAEESDEDMEDAGGKPNGVKKGKGKGKASDEDEDDDENDDEDDEDDWDGMDLEEFVVCTLDTERTFQQPLDITIGEGEKVFFLVSGTHAIHLSGNYIIPDQINSDEDSDDEYDLHPDIDLLETDDEGNESDELDHLEDTPRVQEVSSDDEEAPKLVASSGKKNKNKRPVDDESSGLDDMIAKEEAKLSKKQRKKLKNNKGEAVAAETKTKESPGTKDKKVQFAKNLEQGPTGAAKEKIVKGDKGDKGEKKAGSNVKVVQGVTVDDRKIGTGRTVKAGDKVGMRYIGKLENGKVFDSNKKGSPFTCKVGKGEVIKGWDIGIVGMAIGGERRLTIPPHLAYGSKGLPDIPPNSTLIFDLKLLEIK